MKKNIRNNTLRFLSLATLGVALTSCSGDFSGGDYQDNGDNAPLSHTPNSAGGPQDNTKFGQLELRLSVPIGDDTFRVGGGFLLIRSDGSTAMEFVVDIDDDGPFLLNNISPGTGYSVELDPDGPPLECLHSDTGVELVGCRFEGTNPSSIEIRFGSSTSANFVITGLTDNDAGGTSAQTGYFRGSLSIGLDVGFEEVPNGCVDDPCTDGQICLRAVYPNGDVDGDRCFETCGTHPQTGAVRGTCSGNDDVCELVGELGDSVSEAFDRVCVDEDDLE